MQHSLFSRCAEALFTTDPGTKVHHTHALRRDWLAGLLAHQEATPVRPIGEPGRPARPALVDPRHLPRRNPSSDEGRAILFHALTHIEFNAINLALDAVYRFRDLPADFYADWLQVADEEATHFTLLRDHLQGLQHDYGDWPGHDGLWDMARKTAHDPLIRMALVPRCLEARGLDVNPGIRAKLVAAGDQVGAALLDIILRDEIGHVAIGDRWFRHLCAARGLDAELRYRQLLDEYMKGPPRPPFHLDARRAAGFSDAEIAYLEGVG